MTPRELQEEIARLETRLKELARSFCNVNAAEVTKTTEARHKLALAVLAASEAELLLTALLARTDDALPSLWRRPVMQALERVQRVRRIR